MKATVLQSVRSIALGAALAAGGVGALTFYPNAASAAVEIQPPPKEFSDVADAIGRAVAAKADEQLKAEVGTYARDNLFGVTGTLKPDGDVTFSRAGLCTVGDRKGAAFEFVVHARAKVDVGTRRLGVNMVRKIWAVDTRQVIQLTVLPKQKEDGSVVAEVTAEIVSATATPEREAKQSHADGFRDRVSSALREKLSAFTGEHDVKGVLDKVK